MNTLLQAKPILCIGPVDGDAAEILRSTGHDSVFSYNDSIGIHDFLSGLKNGKQGVGKITKESFSRRELTKQIASLLS